MSNTLSTSGRNDDLLEITYLPISVHTIWFMYKLSFNSWITILYRKYLHVKLTRSGQRAIDWWLSVILHVIQRSRTELRHPWTLSYRRELFIQASTRQAHVHIDIFSLTNGAPQCKSRHRLKNLVLCYITKQRATNFQASRQIWCSRLKRETQWVTNWWKIVVQYFYHLEKIHLLRKIQLSLENQL